MTPPEGSNEEREVLARTLMAQGLSDDDIAARTGLPLIRLLALRAAAAAGGFACGVG